MQSRTGNGKAKLRRVSAGHQIGRQVFRKKGKCGRCGGYEENDYQVRRHASVAKPDRDTHSIKVNQQGLRAKLGNQTSESGKNGPCGLGLPTSDAVAADSNVSGHFRLDKGHRGCPTRRRLRYVHRSLGTSVSGSNVQGCAKPAGFVHSRATGRLGVFHIFDRWRRGNANNTRHFGYEPVGSLPHALYAQSAWLCGVGCRVWRADLYNLPQSECSNHFCAGCSVSLVSRSAGACPRSYHCWPLAQTGLWPLELSCDRDATRVAAHARCTVAIRLQRKAEDVATAHTNGDYAGVTGNQLVRPRRI